MSLMSKKPAQPGQVRAGMVHPNDFKNKETPKSWCPCWIGEGICCAGIAACLAPIALLICPCACTRECLRNDNDSLNGEEKKRQHSDSTTVEDHDHQPTVTQPAPVEPMDDGVSAPEHHIVSTAPGHSGSATPGKI
ncbi:hypothetical protein CC79DRAFT_1366660 [Sarocladium strictum]